MFICGVFGWNDLGLRKEERVVTRLHIYIKSDGICHNSSICLVYCSKSHSCYSTSC